MPENNKNLLINNDKHPERKTKEANWWLTDKDFLMNNNFEDKHYLITLCEHLSNFLIKIPVKVLTTFNRRTERLFIQIGNQTLRPIKVDVNYSTYDFITMFDRIVYPFYPSYIYESTEERPYTKQEIADMVSTGKITIDEAFNSSKKEYVYEKGVIERIFLTDDKFILNVNGIRHSKVAKMPLSTFLESLRTLKNDDEKRAYIFHNSRTIDPLDYSQKIEIKYEGKMLLNFFRIQGQELYNEPLTEVGPQEYHWGKFHVHIPEGSIKDDCYHIIDKIKLQKEEESATIK